MVSRAENRSANIKYWKLFRDSLGWLVEFIAKFLQFQPEVQQKILIADVSTTVL